MSDVEPRELHRAMRILEISSEEAAAAAAGKLFARWQHEVIRAELPDRAALWEPEHLYLNGGKRRIAIDYRTENLDVRISDACPKGIDVYFDNTAGAISDAVFKHLGVGARVVTCGTASVESWNPTPPGPRVERHLLVKRARMQGFLIFDYAERYAEGLEALTAWIRAGLIHYREDILEGMALAPGSIAGLYRGENLGKRLIRIAVDEAAI